MDLIEAMEEMEKNGGVADRNDRVHTTPTDDFFLQQIAHLHARLKAQWAMQYRSSAPSITIPFPWIVARTLRLLEEYPDGLTEAVLVTELMTHLHHRERRNLKRQRTPTAQEILEEDDDAVLSARVLAYANHTVQLSVRPAQDADEEDERNGDYPATSAKSEGDDNSIVRMHLHQRFRSCLSALQAMGIGAPSTEYPFTKQRSLLLTSVKLLERKARNSSNVPTLLPTPYVAVVLEDHERELRDRAWRFPQVDALAADVARDEHALQQLLVTAQVLDIGAVRPCTTPFHIQRQVVLLGDVGNTTTPASASHLLLLWDDQVALSRLFHVGDVLTILYPFVHLAGPDDVEVHTVMAEIASQQRCSYYLEYGSATTVFVTRRRRKARNATDSTHSHGSAGDLQDGEDRRCMAVGVPQPGWIGFSVYGHVASVTVSHGVPLLAAFYHSYYDPKTNGTAAKLPRQSLNRAIVSKYYLVVLVELYDAISGDTLTVELTGTCAEKALALREGQTVFLEGLVAVDLRRDHRIRASRNDRSALMPSQLFDSTSATHSQQPSVIAAATVAFPDDCYLSSSSRVVALCSDWERIFGRQTDTFRESHVSIVNELPSVLKTHVRSDASHADDGDDNALVARWLRDRALLSKLPMVRGRFLVTGVGWMVPCNERDGGDARKPKRFEWDTSCAKGFSTMLAHRACRRRLEMAPPATGDDNDSASAPPRWRCGFCAEIFAGMEATTQTFCPLLVRLDDGSQWNTSSSSSSSSLVAICYGDAVTTILETPPEEFAQLSLPRKCAVLQQAIGRELDVVLSRCPEHHVLPQQTTFPASAPAALCVQLRIDQAQPVDVFAYGFICDVAPTASGIDSHLPSPRFYTFNFSAFVKSSKFCPRCLFLGPRRHSRGITIISSFIITTVTSLSRCIHLWMTTDQDSEQPQPRGVAQLRRVLMRRALREWASKAQQERQDFVEELLQLFTSSSSSSSSTSSSSSSTAATRAITRRPGVEEVRHCVLSSPSPWLPPACDVLRGEIWQVLLNVYKRNQHGAAAQEFERMMLRLSKLPRDPRLVDECAAVSELLVRDHDTANSSEDRETRRLAVQRDLEILLVWFLTTKSVPYASGMARVVAVFFVLELPLPTVYDCFYQFCATFLPHFVATIDDGSHLPFSGGGGGLTKQHSLSTMTNRESSASDSASTLADDSLATEDAASTVNNDNNNNSVEDTKETRRRRERQQLVEQLLSYHDPQLAHFLSQWCPSGWSEPGQYIPASLFLDDVYNVVAPKAFVYVMDQYLLTGDSRFGVFLLVATLLDARDRLVTLRSSDAVRAALQELFASTLNDDQRMPHLCLLAARLRHRTPRSYATSLVESLDSSCASRRASEMAFEMPPPGSEALRKKLDVDMSQWQKRESTSYAGKIFWYHTPTGRTQWEHPAEQFEPAPALFALPVSVNEVAPQIMGERSSAHAASSVAPPTAPSSSGSNLAMRPAEYSGDLKFFIVDCRRLRSSEDLKSGRIPAAFTLDPSVFESPELIDRTMDALNAMKSRVHIVLVGNGVGVPPELLKSDEMKTSVRDAVRHDADTMNRAALFFQKKGFRFISCLDGGYSSWHAYVRDDPSSSPHELLNHVEDECHYCRYDTILRTGEDPMKKRQKQQAMTRRKKPGMPTTTNLLVNGGEGDASIVSTYGEAPGSNHNASSSSGPPSSGRRSLTTSLSLTRASLTSMNMTAVRSKLSDVKMPKLSGWRRGLSFVTAPSSTGNPVNHDSSSETATADDGGSDRGSSTTDELETSASTVAPAPTETDATEHVTDPIPSPKIEEPKSFVGVFTIDYSDDEDEGLTSEDATVSVAPPTVSA